jgi:ketosteroid isomerase-like protein
MSNQEEVITQFYQALVRGDPEGMVRHYHDDIVFRDPAFGELRGNDARNMWRLLVSPAVKASFSDVGPHSARWTAAYVFKKTGRKVVNRISAEFEFKDGKIVRHTDHFDFWRWTSQALGLPGYLLGWTSFMKARCIRQTSALLKDFDASRNVKLLG